MWRLTVAIITLFYCCSGTNADSSISAATGNTVSIWCKSPEKTSVFWQYQREITSRDVFLSTGGGIADAYRSRIGLDTLSNGQFVLTIYNLTTNDSGIYVCSEEAGFGARHYTRILVKEPNTHSSESATVGSTIQLQCRTTVQIRVVWVRQRLNTDAKESLTTETHVLPQHASKFALATVSHGDYALTIRNVQLGDSALYSCVEAERSRHTVNLTVSDVNECLSNPCVNGGRCVDGVNEYNCVCPDGYGGTNCDTDIIDECSSNPCTNGGICVDLVSKYVCVCQSGFSGKQCENDVGHFETSTKKIDQTTGLSGAAVGLIVSLVFIFAVVLICFVLFAVWYWRKLHRQRRDSGTQLETVPLKEDNNNEHDVDAEGTPQVINEGAAENVLSESLNFVSGVTLVNSKLFVLKSRYLDVYGTSVKPYVLVRQVQVPDFSVHAHNNMTSCAKHHSLYISDFYNSRVLKIPLDEKTDDVKMEAVEGKTTVSENEVSSKRPIVVHWQVEKGKPSGLSVTDDHTLLVSCFEGRKLIELTTEGLPVKEWNAKLIELESHLYCPMQAIKMGDKFVVCHGGDSIWLLDQEGRIMKSIGYAGLKDMKNYSQLAWPCDLAVGNNGHIYVADHYNDRVVELDSELTYVCDVVTRSQRILRPRRLFYDKRGNELYIGVLHGNVCSVSIKNDQIQTDTTTVAD